MSKKLILLLALFVLTGSAKAQLFSKERLANLETFDKRFLSWGYFLGFNQYDFKIEYNGPAEDIQVDRVDGSVALIDLGAGKTIDTHNIKDPVVGFIFGSKGLMYNLTLEGSKFSKLDKS